jgi:hypothetical protein
MIHRPVFYLKREISETGLCLSPQVEPTHLDPLDPKWVDPTWRRIKDPVSENYVLKNMYIV